MLNNKESRNYILSLILAIFLLFPFISIQKAIDYQEINEDEQFDLFNHKNNLIYSGYRNLPHKIHINNNWTVTKSTYDWCSGSGTWSDPYIIENVIINAGNSGSCILIENSNVCFKIKNCILKNSEWANSHAGIKLANTKNGQLIDNDCSNNNGYGISLLKSDNNTISNNIANFNNGNSIYLEDCDNNTISENTLNYNGCGMFLWKINNNKISRNIVNYNREGMVLSDGNKNYISENTVSYNEEGGISMSFCDYSTITRNNATNNEHSGISTTNGDYNVVLNNTFNMNNDGIVIGWCQNNTISRNTASKNKRYGILLYEQAYHNSISNNSMYECSVGIFAEIDLISGNNIDNSNLINGKPLYFYTNEKSLGSNNFTNAGQIILIKCSDSLISNLELSKGSKGISLYHCKNILISNNSVSNNIFCGIFIKHSDNNTILDNTIKDNYYGICLWFSNYNNISGNILINNLFGIDESDSSGNIIENNQFIPTIPGYNVCILIAAIFVILIIIIIKTRFKFDSKLIFI